MNKPLNPNDYYFQLSWNDLENAWRMLASPEKFMEIDPLIQSLKTLNRECGPEKAAFHMVAATAWLTDDGAGSQDG